MHDLALERSMPVAIHVAESAVESELMNQGSGALAPVSGRLASDFRSPGCGTTTYLDRLGVLDRATAVHLGEIVPAEVPRLAAAARGAVTCPRSNRFLSNRLAPVRRLLAAGVPVGVGTDSSASNRDLDLFEELRHLQAAYPSLSSTALIEMATSMGAISLGLENRFGMLEPGMQADLAVFRVGTTATPEEDLVRFAGRDALEAVLAAGAWRVRDKTAVGESTDSLVRAAKATTERARQALDALPS
jgi:cytosine/adenosine deaminase-related metal-dependent hydrolase